MNYDTRLTKRQRTIVEGVCFNPSSTYRDLLLAVKSVEDDVKQFDPSRVPENAKYPEKPMKFDQVVDLKVRPEQEIPYTEPLTQSSIFNNSNTKPPEKSGWIYAPAEMSATEAAEWRKK